MLPWKLWTSSGLHEHKTKRTETRGWGLQKLGRYGTAFCHADINKVVICLLYFQNLPTECGPVCKYKKPKKLFITNDISITDPNISQQQKKSKEKLSQNFSSRGFNSYLVTLFLYWALIDFPILYYKFQVKLQPHIHKTSEAVHMCIRTKGQKIRRK